MIIVYPQNTNFTKKVLHIKKFVFENENTDN